MKKILTAVIFTVFLGNFLSAQTSVSREWLQVYNSPDSSYEIASSLDVHRHIFVLGYQMNKNAAVLIKYTPAGVKLWEVVYPGITVEDNKFRVSHLVVDEHCNVYVVGTVDQNVTTIKFNGSSGSVMWVNTYDNGGEERGSAIARDKNGNLYVTGASQDSSGVEDVVTLKLDSNGTRQWVRRYDAGGVELGKYIVVDKAANAYVCAAAPRAEDSILLIKYDSSGAEKWVRGYGKTVIFAMKEDGRGNIYLGGTTSMQYYYVLLRYDSSGTFHWEARHDGGQINSQIHSITIDSQGKPIVTGYVTGDSPDYGTLKYDTSGVVIWAQQYDDQGGGSDYGMDVAVDQKDDVYVTGLTQGGARSVELTTIKYKGTDGTPLWEDSYPAIEHTRPTEALPGSGIVADTVNAYVVGDSKSSATGYDIVTIKYRQSTSCTLVADAGPDQTICSGACAALDGSRGQKYSWSPSAGLSDTAVANPQACPSVTTSYTFTIINTGGCTASDVVTINLQSLPDTPASITGPASVLRGGTYSYSVTVANANSYIWSYSGTGATISGNTNPVTITFACNATNGTLSVYGVNDCGNGTPVSLSVTTNPGATIHIYSSKFTIGSGCHPSTVKSAIMPINEAGTKLGFKIFRSNKIGITAERRNFDNIWNGNCLGVSGHCSYVPSSNVTTDVTITGPELVYQGGGSSYKYTLTVPAGKRYLVLGKYNADASACAIYNSGPPPCYVYPGKRTLNRNNHHDQCDEDDDGDDDGDDDTHFNCCQSKDMYLSVIQDAHGRIRPGNTDAIKGSLLLICSPDYISFTDTVELLPVVYESVDGSWGVSTQVAPPPGFYSTPDSLLSANVGTSFISTLQFTLVDTGSEWTNTVIKTQLTHLGRNIAHSVSPGMINNKNTKNYLAQNFPNPFSSSTTIPYFLPVACKVNLSVYDVMGKQIATLAEGIQQSGQYTKTWNGCDNVNCNLPGGVYFIRLQALSLDNARAIINSKTMLYIK